MTEALYHSFGGLVFGQHPDADPGDVPYELVSADGLEDLVTSPGLLPSGGRDGRGPAPMWADPGSWVSVVEIYGADTAEWKYRRDQLRKATSSILARTTDTPYDMGYGDEAIRTIFARVSKRSIPVDRAYLVDRFAEAAVAFTASDPLTYGPITVETLERGEMATITSAGWAPSQRWRWVVHGPAVNPRLTLSVDGFDDQVIRLDGHVNTGQNLLVESSPDDLVTTVGGFARFGDFDGGSTLKLAQYFSVQPGEQTVSYDADSGAGDATFTWRTALI